MTEWGLLDLFHSWQVYDLSEFMDRHPGGPTTILAWAGKDASKFFNEIHKGVKTLGFQTFMWLAPCEFTVHVFPADCSKHIVTQLVVSHCLYIELSCPGCLQGQCFATDGKESFWCLRIDSYLRPESYLGDLGVDGELMSDEFWHTLREAGFTMLRSGPILAHFMTFTYFYCLSTYPGLTVGICQSSWNPGRSK